MKRTIIAATACVMPFATQAGDWKYSVAPYVWLPTISLDSSNVNAGGSPIDGDRVDIGPTDYLSALDFALMLTGDMRKDDWVVMGDFIYLDFGIDDKDIDLARPGSGPIAGSYEAGLSGSIIALAGGKTFVRTETYYIDGESDLTWQAVLGLAYGFDWGELFVNYRHLDYDFGDTDNFSDLGTTFSGPSLGATFRF